MLLNMDCPNIDQHEVYQQLSADDQQIAAKGCDYLQSKYDNVGYDSTLNLMLTDLIKAGVMTRQTTVLPQMERRLPRVAQLMEQQRRSMTSEPRTKSIVRHPISQRFKLGGVDLDAFSSNHPQ